MWFTKGTIKSNPKSPEKTPKNPRPEYGGRGGAQKGGKGETVRLMATEVRLSFPDVLHSKGKREKRNKIQNFMFSLSLRNPDQTSFFFLFLWERVLTNSSYMLSIECIC